MPWLSIIMFVISFLFSKSKGASTAQAAGIGALAAGATYLVADPANADNLLGIGTQAGSVGAKKTVPGSTSETSTVTSGAGTSTAGSLLTTGAGLADTAIKTTGSTLSSWGGAGTATVIGTTAAAGALTSSSFSKYLPWFAGGALLLLLSK